MPTKQFKLKFETIQSLWRFIERTGVTNIEMNWKEQSLICACSEPHLQIAKEEAGLKQCIDPKRTS